MDIKLEEKQLITEMEDTIKKKLTQHLKRRLQNECQINSIVSNSELNFASKNINNNISIKKIKSSPPATIVANNSGKLSVTKKPKLQKTVSISSASDASICEQDQQDTIPMEKTKAPDILTMILNQKKLSLMRDPEVIKFFENIRMENKKK